MPSKDDDDIFGDDYLNDSDDDDAGGNDLAFFPSVEDDEDGNVVNISKPGKKKKEKKRKGWPALGVDRAIIKALTKKGFKGPTPIQKKAIPAALSGADVVGMARTGSGKTAAFVVPLVQRLHAHSGKVGVRALVLSPTRELATQTFALVLQLAKFSDLRASLLVGGESMEAQFAEMARNPDILVATPGRLLHLILEVGWSMRQLEMVIFDEADRLFEMGFEAQIRELMAKMPASTQRQTMLFSATMPANLAEFAKAGLHEPKVLRLDTEVTLSPLLRTAYITLRSHERAAALVYLLSAVIPPDQPTLVFAATHQHVEYLTRLLTECSIQAVGLYGKLDPQARRINVSRFRSGEVNVMVVTDIAARGVDIPLLDNVVNYHFPPSEKIFIHRVGRVARAGRAGTAFSFVTQDEVPYMIDLHLFLGRPLRNTFSDEDAASVAAVAATASQTSLPTACFSHGYYGRIPYTLLEEHAENLARIHNACAELPLLSRTMTNSMRAYKDTRTKPSREAVRRAKKLDQDTFHPAFLCLSKEANSAAASRQLLSPVDNSRMQFMSSIRSYRPTMTIMEVQARLKRSTIDKSVMREKRKAHDALLVRNRPAAIDAEESNDSPYIEARKVIHKYLRKKERQQKTAEDGDQDEDSSDSDSDSGSDNDSDFDGEQKSKAPAAPLPTVAKAPVASKIRVSRAEQRRRKKRADNPVASASDEDAKRQCRAERANEQAVVEPMFTSRDAFDAQVAHERAMSVAQKTNVQSERIDDVILSLLPDDAEGINAHRQSLRWDKKKMRYVQVSAGAPAPGRRYGRDEAGNKIELSAKKFEPKRYEAWKKKTKLELPAEGGMEPNAKAHGAKHGVPLHLRHKWHTKNAATDVAKAKVGQTTEQIAKKNKEKELRRLKQNKSWRRQQAAIGKKKRAAKLASLQKPARHSKSLTIIRKKR